jgi:hypothetical protein
VVDTRDDRRRSAYYGDDFSQNGRLRGGGSGVTLPANVGIFSSLCVSYSDVAEFVVEDCCD